MFVPSDSEWRAARAVIELSAIAAGSLSGALHGVRREYDLVGVVTIALITGLGGGMLRDVLIAQGGVLALQHSSLLLTALIAAFIGTVLGHHTAYLSAILWFVDSLSLGLFTVAGIQRAEEVGLKIAPALLLGVLTGTGGGLLRDVICRDTPALLLPGAPYATAALLGGLVYYGLVHALGWPVTVSEWIATLSCFGLRALASWRGWIVPKPIDVTRHVRRWGSRRKPGREGRP